MEPSNNPNKIQAMKNYKRAKFAYNLALYSLTSIITCFFFSSPFWFPSITNHFLISSLPSIISFCYNAKCFFVLGNLIVIILVGESKIRQSPSSPTLDIYDEYVARSRRSHHKEVASGSAKPLYFEEKINKEIKFNSTSRGEEKRKGMRSCKSEVWGERGMLVKMEKTRGKKVEQGEKIKMGMRSSKSAVWSESETNKMEKAKAEKEEQSSKTSMNDEVKRMGLRSSKSAVWSEKVRLKMERGVEDKEEDQSCKNVIHDEEKKMGMRSSKSAVWSESVRLEMEGGDDQGKEEEKSRNKANHHEEKKTGMSSRSAVWGESEIVERERGECVKKEEHEGRMKMGMRSCRSEIWSESEIMRLGRTNVAKEEEQQLNVFNKRVEDFIARVNKQRLLEAK